MAATHNPTVLVNVTLAPPPTPTAGFGGVAWFIPEPVGFGGDWLDDELFLDFVSAEGVAAALTSNFIDANTANVLTRAFAQNPSPERLRVVTAAASGANLIPEYNAMKAAPNGGLVYWIAVGGAVTATAPARVALANAARADGRQTSMVSSEAQLLSVPLGGGPLAGVELVEGLTLYYHDAPLTAGIEIIHPAGRLALDPDARSFGFRGAANVPGLVTGLTDAQRATAVANNVNTALRYGGVPTFVHPATTTIGRPILELLNADWIKARAQEALIDQDTQAAARGDLIGVDIEGQALTSGVISNLLERAQALGKIVPGQILVTLPPITAADIAAGIIRVNAAVQTTTEVRRFIFNVDLSRSAVVTAP